MSRFIYKPLLKLSPFNLLQEIYQHDPWKIMICCMMLNCTKRAQVDKVRNALFEKYPSHAEMADADQNELASMIKSLGFSNRRSKTMIKFSKSWSDDEKTINELPGIGPYALDSWKLFVDCEMVDDPSDHVLKIYVEWLKNENNKLKYDI